MHPVSASRRAGASSRDPIPATWGGLVGAIGLMTGGGRDLAPRLDTSTLVSFVATLRRPQSGGELFVYGATSDDPAVPRLPNGFSYDQPAVEAQYEHVRLECPDHLVAQPERQTPPRRRC